MIYKRLLFLFIYFVMFFSCREKDYSKLISEFSTGLVFSGDKVLGRREEFSPFAKEICAIVKFKDPLGKNMLVEHEWIQATEKRTVFIDSVRTDKPEQVFKLRWKRDDEKPFEHGDYKIKLLINKKQVKEVFFTITSTNELYSKYKDNPGFIMKTAIKITNISLGTHFDKEKESLANPSNEFKQKEKQILCLVLLEGVNLSGSKLKASWFYKDRGVLLGETEQLLEKDTNKALFSYKTKKKLEKGDYELHLYYNDKQQPEKIVFFKVI
ncbi:MAG: hypothetical protein JXA60_00510 [Candidatus Coatesbacteria bacterium]|nr:hypothetical protein [Candidatus Coatesbacteria bacterium]